MILMVIEYKGEMYYMSDNDTDYAKIKQLEDAGELSNVNNLASNNSELIVDIINKLIK